MVRDAVFSGSFYPDDPNELRDQVSQYLELANPAKGIGKLRALVAPHAGYIYSGPIAGSAYKLLLEEGRHLKRVLLLGPSHQVGIAGMALSRATAFCTPLGLVPVDPLLRRVVEDMPGVLEAEEAHLQEHSLEVQLPFLQMALGDSLVLPLVVGHCPASRVAAVVGACVDAFADLLVVVSSDLSHYQPYLDALRCDFRTAERICMLDATIEPDRACGCFPLNGLLEESKNREWDMVSLDLRNSGDTCGDRRRVVGYGAFAAWDRKQ